MKNMRYFTIFILALLAITPAAVYGQDINWLPQGTSGVPQTAPQAVVPQTSNQPTYTQQQIDQMVAPIALYPDQLVSQILMASTYPLEVVEANRWLSDPNNSRLSGDQLAQALEQQPWDPSVKSLVPFPQIISMMDKNLQWTEQLGDAFLAQQDDVMNSVQHLRQMAQASGNLTSTPQQTVVSDQGAIVIQPANPEVVYVPVYNPTVVYGAWPWAAYPPYYFAPPPNYYYASTGIISFGIGVGIVDLFWGWDRWDWHHHRIDIDDRRYEVINRGHPPHVSGVWEHNPYHRHGVPYANPRVRAEFQNASNQSRRQYRGFPEQQHQSARSNAQPAVQQLTGAIQPHNAPNNMHNEQRFNHEGRNNFERRTQAPAAQPQPAHPQTAQPQQVQQQREQQQREHRQFQHQVTMPQTGNAAPQVQQRSQQVQPQHQQFQQQRQQQQRSSPVFESFSHGQEVRAQSQRGSFSRSSAPSAPQVQQHAAPAQHGNSGGGQHGGPQGGSHGAGQQGGGGHGDGGHGDNGRGDRHDGR